MDTHLPLELYRPVIQHLPGDRKALLALSLTSRSLYHEAIPFLYQDLILSGRDTLRKFLNTILHSQALADCVQGWGYDTDTQTEAVQGNRGIDFLHEIRSGLVAMRNLRRLWFKFDFLGSGVLLKNTTFKLESLSWSCGTGSGQGFLRSWLQSHPNLTELWLDLPKDSLFILQANPMYLQDLIRVGGSHANLATLLPHCPSITEVYWDRSIRDSQQVDWQLLLSLQQLRKLVFEWNPTGLPLEHLASYLPNLEVLQVNNYYQDETSQQFNLLHAVEQMPKLRWLAVTKYHPEEKIDEKSVQQLFASNAALEYISVEEHNDPKARVQDYLHYQRGQSAPSQLRTTAPVEVCNWYWAFHEEQYLDEKWDGN